MKKYPSRIDVAVLLIFFARPEQTKQVFEQIRCARPSKLYLYQDGARENRPDDIENIRKCREIVSNIDWECQVYTLYQPKNFGCDPSEYLAQKWMFGTEEMGIVLEDDDVPSQSFFSFCKELLEKYKYDERINMICGMNNTEVSEHTPYSYLFSISGSITGWASWKRVIDEWKDYVDFVNDEYAIKQFHDRYRYFMDTKRYVKRCKQHNASGIAHYESILGSNARLNSRLNIVPKYNMISNIGITENSTHSVSNYKMLPRGIRRIFYMKTYDIEFPLNHPPYVIQDVAFEKRLYRIMGIGHPFVRYYRRIESLVLRLWYGDYRGVWRTVCRILNIK